MDEGFAEVTVRLGGQDHVIRAEGEQARLEACLKLFTDRVAALKERSPGIAERRATVLAVLSIADDLLDARREERERARRVRRRTDDLRTRIETALDSDPAE